MELKPELYRLVESQLCHLKYLNGKRLDALAATLNEEVLDSAEYRALQFAIKEFRKKLLKVEEENPGIFSHEIRDLSTNWIFDGTCRDNYRLERERDALLAKLAYCQDFEEAKVLLREYGVDI